MDLRLASSAAGFVAYLISYWIELISISPIPRFSYQPA